MAGSSLNMTMPRTRKLSVDFGVNIKTSLIFKFEKRI